MPQHLSALSLVVADYDDAIAFYVNRLGFELIEDTPLDEHGKRWVMVSPPGAGRCGLLLARAANPQQQAAVGNQTGGRVFLFLQTDDFWRDYQRYRDNGVVFEREPLTQPYGIVAVFRDLYGNLWDLIQRNDTA